MQKFAVSLEITTTRASVKELINSTGLPLSASSHNIGDIGGDRRPFAMTVGVFEPEGEGSDLNSLMQRLIERLDFVRLRDLRTKLSDVTLLMSISVFFDTANCCVEISSKHAAVLGGNDILTTISCYPTSVDSEQT